MNMMEQVVIAGVDYSLRGPAICIWTGDEVRDFTYKDCQFYFLTDVKSKAKVYETRIFGEFFMEYSCDESRYDSISDWAMDKLTGCREVAIEGYAYGATGRVFNIAENTGILKYKLYNATIPIEIIPPQAVKKVATGKGNARKDAMHAAWFEETGINLQGAISPKKSVVDSPVSDVVDAYYICKCLWRNMQKRTWGP